MRAMERTNAAVRDLDSLSLLREATLLGWSQMRTETLELVGTDGPPLTPLGPGSLSWRYAGDLRAALLLPRAALLEAMHPVVGAGPRRLLERSWPTHGGAARARGSR